MASSPNTRDPNREERDAVRQENLTALHAKLAEQVRALRTGEDWSSWLRMASRLHHYSFNNVLLILAQRPDASTVAGYRAWQDLGRQVEKGERGIRILAPVLRRTDPSDTLRQPDADQEAATISQVVGYRVTHVWDVCQTYGKPLPEKPSPQVMTGQAPEGLWAMLAEQVRSNGFALIRGDCEGANGLTDFVARTVHVRPDVDDAQAVKTLAHELGHVLLHNTGRPVVCRGVVEVEAESVAFLVTSSHGLASDSYTFPYVLGWASGIDDEKPEDVVARVGQRVVRAASQILDPPLSQDDEAMNAVAVLAVAAREVTSAMREQAETTLVNASRPTREQLMAIHADAADFFEQLRPASWVDDYLRGRGLGGAVEPGAPWRIGYAPDSWTALTERLQAAGYSDATLEASGLVLRARTGRLVDRFRNRLMLAVRDADGDVVAFVGRAAPDADDRTPKYLNSPTTAMHRKGEQLFGMGENASAVRYGAIPTLTEGPLDAIAVQSATDGRHAGLALCGTAITDAQAEAMARRGHSPDVVVALDSDTAGHQAAERAYTKLTAVGLTPRAADLPPGIDPAELLQTHGSARLSAAIGANTRPLVDQLVEQRLAARSDSLRWPEGGIAAVRAVAPLFDSLEPAHRQRLIRTVVDLTDLLPSTVTLEIRRRLWLTRAPHQTSARRSSVEASRPLEERSPLGPRSVRVSTTSPSTQAARAR